MKQLMIILCFMLFFQLSATIINIPEDQPTIQAGINAAVDADTVLVQPGTYFENINYNGKNITVASLFLTTQDTTYISQTIIDGNQNGSVVTFESGEDSTAVLCGLTITNGNAYSGGGIDCRVNSCPTIMNSKITNNAALVNGGGIYCRNDSSPYLLNVTISHNTAENGGGIDCRYNSNLILDNVIIINNSATIYGGGLSISHDSNPDFSNSVVAFNSSLMDGGGIYCHSSNPELNNVTITNNSAGYYGGGIYSCYSDLNIQNSIISENSALMDGGGIYYLESDMEIENVSIFLNSASQNGGGMYSHVGSNTYFNPENRCNIYWNDSGDIGLIGNDIYNNSNNTMNVIVDTFTVINPTNYYAYPIENFTFDIINSTQIDADLYVSPNGNNSNSGLNETDPFRTIQYALSRIYPDSLDQNTIYLAAGIYSPQTNGETYPIEMLNYVSIQGFSQAETILDADATGSVLRFDYQENPGNISNLTLRNGFAEFGGGICSYNSNPSLQNLKIINNTATMDGGGTYFNYSNPTLENITLANNSVTYYGGGIYCWFSNIFIQNTRITGNTATMDGGGIYYLYSDLELENVSIINNYATRNGGGMAIHHYSHPNFHSENRCSIYSNDSGINGNDLYTNSNNTVNVILDTFTVLYPTSHFAFPLHEFSFDILNGVYEQINADLFVSPDGDDSNSGLTANDPLKTISYALIRICADSLNQNTIHLSAGIYSPQTNGESFPLRMINYVSLQGYSDSETILDADSTESIIRLEYLTGSNITDLTITGGSSFYGGGIYCRYSNPSLANLIISNNYASTGGGIYCWYSNPIMQNIRISNNIVAEDGGGIYCYNSDIVLDEIVILNNIAEQGGGVFCSNSDPLLENVTISTNIALTSGGGIWFSNSNPIFHVDNRSSIYYNTISDEYALGQDIFCNYNNSITAVLDTFTVLYPTNYYAFPIDNYVFDILHGAQELINADLYVSADNGSNDNNGLTPETPLKTIQYATAIIYADSLNQHTIHIADGVYSSTTNDEVFPIDALNYVSMVGASEVGVILDTGGESRVITCTGILSSTIANMTIINGSANHGGGIYCSDSNLSLENLTLSCNTAYDNGGGVYCIDSDPSLVNITLIDNIAHDYGGGIYCDSSNPSFENVLISNNLAWDDGGGIYLYSSSNPNLENVTISNNSSDDGSGLYCYYSDPILCDVLITNNFSTSNTGKGGGIFCLSSDPSSANVIISNNSASLGGGIYCYDNSNPSFSIEDRCSIYSNNTSNRGSGKEIYASDCGIISVIVDTFTVMTPTDYHASPLNNFTFDILNAVNGQVAADLYVSAETGDNNNDGLTPQTPLRTIKYATEIIFANSTNQHIIHLADGVYSSSNNGEYFPVEVISYVSLIGESENGVILDAENDTRLMISNCVTTSTISNMTLTNGSATNYPGYGGGIYCSGSDLYLENVTVSNNMTSYNGGGIYCVDSEPSLNNVTITNNSSDDGGGFYCTNSNPSLENVTISNNIATGFGGGIYCYNSNPSLENVTLSGNSAKRGGGFFSNESNPNLNSVLIVNNSVAGYYARGGGIYCDDSNPILVNVSLSGNTSTEVGGGIHCFDSELSLINCIMWNDSPEEINLSCYYELTSLTVSYSDIQNGQAGIITQGSPSVYWLEGNIDQDPIFIETGDYPFSLTEFSPCLNYGIPDTTGLNLPEFDLAGNPRIYYDRIDMGAYEYQGAPFSADFEADVTSGLIPLEVQFTDLSTGGLPISERLQKNMKDRNYHHTDNTREIISWAWDFDNDGTIDSNEQNPLFTYTQSGVYTVSLTVSDGSNTDTETKVDYISVGDELIADFEADVTSGLIPLEVQFTDLSTGGFPALMVDTKISNNSKIVENDNTRDITSWEWDFNNDSIVDSYEQNPIFTYNQIGVFTVSLTVSDGTNTDTEIKLDYINVTGTGIEYGILPLKTELVGAYPNPFNPSTTIKYNLKENSDIRIEVFNIKGQKIISLIDQTQNAGYHSIVWNGKDEIENPVSSGIYYYQLIMNGEFVEVKKCLLLK